MNYYRDYYNYENNNYNKPLYTENKPSTLEPMEGFFKGNMFTNLYNGYKLDKTISINPSNKQAELLTIIDSLTFSIIDLSLYLDIYPDNNEVLDLYNYYKDSLNEYMKLYEEKYGPLVLDNNLNDNNYFNWILSPWPWEGYSV